MGKKTTLKRVKVSRHWSRPGTHSCVTCFVKDCHGNEYSIGVFLIGKNTNTPGPPRIGTGGYVMVDRKIATWYSSKRAKILKMNAII